MMDISSASFGRRQEYAVIAELLKRGFDVYQTLVDDKGIDCIVRISHKKYWDVQIKARSKGSKYNTQFSAMKVKPRDNCVFVFYTERNDTFWVISSQDVADLGVRNQTGKNRGKYTLTLPRSADKPGRFAKYKNSFDILRHQNPGSVT